MQRVERLPQPPPRAADSHKGTYGSVLVVGGSRGMSGAVCLAGLAALRGGAGLVFVAVPSGILDVVATVEPSYLTVPLPEDERGRLSLAAWVELEAAFASHTAMAVGPGWGQSDDLTELACRVFQNVERPLVVDADGLNALAKRRDVLGRHPRSDAAVRVLTPHPGEFARLLDTDTRAVQADRENLATEFAREHGVVLVLKGHGTIVTDGERLAVNTTGNPGMATGGVGDVLTGLVAALLAQGMTGFDAARLAVHLHGLAGDLAAAELSQPALVASDLPRFLPQAWLRVTE
jgi:NAD(P)H-hydrate epimerase